MIPRTLFALFIALCASMPSPADPPLPNWDEWQNALKAWVIAKLLWDPSRDVAALMANFTWGYYSKAAPAMVAFDSLLEIE